MAIGISEGIPDAESSDAVQSVFEFDEGFLQCRPVGHKSKRMVFVDYDSIEHATRALQAHQGWKWEPVDGGFWDENVEMDVSDVFFCSFSCSGSRLYNRFYFLLPIDSSIFKVQTMLKPTGLKIDYDQDARNKRNTALDLGLYEKFYAIGPRKAEVESESQMFARLKAESSSGSTTKSSKAPPAAKAKEKGLGALGAKIQIKSKDAKAAKAAAEVESKAGASGALVQYSSDSEEAEEQNVKRAKTDRD